MSDDMLRRLVAYEFRKIHSYPMTITGIEQALNEMPSVKPAQKTGQWIINSDGYYPYCSICNNEPKSRIMTDYCPSCGAYMKGESNDKTTSN